LLFLLVFLSPEPLGSTRDCCFLMFFVAFVGFFVVWVTETAFAVPFQVGRALSDMRNADQLNEWITSARARLAARRNGRPSTKAGAVRALWPEIQQALKSGQTLKTIRDWLEAEGVSLRYNQLTTYVRRIRRTEATEARKPHPAPDRRAVEPEAKHEPVSLEVVPAQDRDPLANLRVRQGKSRTFEYNPDFKEEDLL
jgi:hypothetical protein